MNDEELEALFGPLAEQSDYKRGEHIAYMQDGNTFTGTIRWVGLRARGRYVVSDQAIYYAVQSDQNQAFPTIVFPSDVIEKR